MLHTVSEKSPHTNVGLVFLCVLIKINYSEKSLQKKALFEVLRACTKRERDDFTIISTNNPGARNRKYCRTWKKRRVLYVNREREQRKYIGKKMLTGKYQNR